MIVKPLLCSDGSVLGSGNVVSSNEYVSCHVRLEAEAVVRSVDACRIEFLLAVCRCDYDLISVPETTSRNAPLQERCPKQPAT